MGQSAFEFRCLSSWADWKRESHRDVSRRAISEARDIRGARLHTCEKLMRNQILSRTRHTLHPDWDGLRGESRFEKIVADLAPKKAEK